MTESVKNDEIRGHSRSLLILLRDKKNQLQLALRNNDVIGCSKCSDYSEDPFLDKRITAKRGQLSITQYFDIGFHPSLSIYAFRYQPKTKQFKTILAKHIRYEQTDSGRYQRHVSNHVQEFGVTLKDFNPQWLKATVLK